MSYTSILFHCIFATKERRPWISKEIRPRLWAYMGGIARSNGVKALAIGGVQDHVHLLLSLHPVMPVAKAMQLIKAGSSKWFHEQIPRRPFAWQEKYGAFTIGVSQVKATIRYILNQEEHHKRRDFVEELRMILKKHGIKAMGEFEGDLSRPCRD